MRLGDMLTLAAPLLSAAIPLVTVFTAALRHEHHVQRNSDTKGQPAERLAESTGRIYRDSARMEGFLYFQVNPIWNHLALKGARV